MDVVDRRAVLRSIGGGVIAAGLAAKLGASLLPRSAEALPLAMEKDLASKADDPRVNAQVVTTQPPRSWRRRRRWVCWWHQGRRHCGWRWRRVAI